MRSFIKSHRKTESFSSDLSEDPFLSKTPNTTPHFPPNPQFTPPYQSNSHSRNSPKKLLTPIRNLFSSLNSHAKSNSVSSASDRLADVIHSGPPSAAPPTTKESFSIQGHSSLTNMSRFVHKPHDYDDEAYSDFVARHQFENKSRPSYRISSSSGSLFDDKTSKTSTSQQQSSLFSRKEQAIAFSNPVEKPSANVHLLQPIPMNETSANVSTSSLDNSMENFRTDDAFFLNSKHGKESTASDSEGDEDANENDDELSDTSSQFSFVRDKRGGRNTSVKYYKTNRTYNNPVILNTLDEDDLGFEDDDYSDYDFMNNGLDEDDVYGTEDANEEEEVHYNKLFADDEPYETLERPTRSNKDHVPQFSFNTEHKNHSSSELLWGPLLEFKKQDERGTNLVSTTQPAIQGRQGKRHIYNKSYHLSIDGFDDLDIQTSSDIGEDILENYLELPGGSLGNVYEATPEPNSNPSLELFDLSSPLINGVTIGNNLGHRLGSIHSVNDGKTGESHANKMFIHRHDSQCLNNKATPKYNAEGVETDHHLKKIRAFHGSVDHGLNSALESKVNEFEKFHLDYFSRLGQPRQLSNILADKSGLMGLGISSIDVHDTNLDVVEESPGTIREDPHKVEKTPLVTNHQARSSVTQMMDFLSKVAPNPNEPGNKRQSIDDMMQRLAVLEMNNLEPESTNRSNSKISKETKTQSEFDSKAVKRSVSGSRYSWCENDDHYDDHKHNHDSFNGEDDHHNSTKEEELLDEINQMPEDFDFEHQKGNSNHLNVLDPGFLRSNSFNKKPLKALMDNKVLNNKIEMAGKTVTFYRSNSLNLDVSRSWSVSRAASTRSMRSFVSVEEESEEDKSQTQEEALDDILSRAEKSSSAATPIFKLSKFNGDTAENESTCSLLGTISETHSK